MSEASIRLDKWLWHARFVKTRALAQKLIERGQVSINGATVTKTSAPARPGDKISVVLGPLRRSVTVRKIGERRGPPAEARELYDESAPPQRLSWDEAGVPLHRRGSGF